MTTSVETHSTLHHESPRTLGPQDLAQFVGAWKTEGEQYEGTFGHANRITAREHFEWLIGGNFLVHRFDGKVGSEQMACMEMIERDPTPSGHRMHTFYNDGHSQRWLLAPRYGQWILTSDWPMADGSTRKVRCISHFDDDGKTRVATWESSPDGQHWETFWRVTSHRCDPDA